MITLVNASGYQFGVENNETGINIENFELTTRPEFKEFLRNKTNEKIGFAVAPPEVEISVEGEVSGATGLMAADFVTAETIANDIDTWGGSGDIYLDEAIERQGRDGWRRASFRLSANAGIEAA